MQPACCSDHGVKSPGPVNAGGEAGWPACCAHPTQLPSASPYFMGGAVGATPAPCLSPQKRIRRLSSERGGGKQLVCAHKCTGTPRNWRYCFPPGRMHPLPVVLPFGWGWPPKAGCWGPASPRLGTQGEACRGLVPPWCGRAGSQGAGPGRGAAFPAQPPSLSDGVVGTPPSLNMAALSL